MKPVRSQGFTLFELILFIVVFSGALVGILSAAGDVARRFGENRVSAEATQAAQRVIETLLALRRDPEIGYAKIPLYPRAACDRFQLRDPVTALPLPAYPLAGLTAALQCELSVETYGLSPCGSAGVVCIKAVVTLAQGSTSLAELTLVMASLQ
jgi:type II secretory pathway pseudopilin PulG